MLEVQSKKSLSNLARVAGEWREFLELIWSKLYLILTIPDSVVKFLLYKLAKLTIRLHCNSRHDILMNTVANYDEPNWTERKQQHSLIATSNTHNINTHACNDYYVFILTSHFAIKISTPDSTVCYCPIENITNNLTLGNIFKFSFISL